jgi:flagellar biosynthesis chaperone FliJ
MANEGLDELQNKREAVAADLNYLYYNVQIELQNETIKELREHISLLEKELDKYRELLQDEMQNAQFYKKGYDYMKKVKTITIK